MSENPGVEVEPCLSHAPDSPALCQRVAGHSGMHVGQYGGETTQWKSKAELKATPNGGHAEPTPIPPREDEHEQYVDLAAIEHVFPAHGEKCQVWYAGSRIDAVFDVVLCVDGGVVAIVVEQTVTSPRTLEQYVVRRTIQWRNVVEISTKRESQES